MKIPALAPRRLNHEFKVGITVPREVLHTPPRSPLVSGRRDRDSKMERKNCRTSGMGWNFRTPWKNNKKFEKYVGENPQKRKRSKTIAKITFTNNEVG